MFQGFFEVIEDGVLLFGFHGMGEDDVIRSMAMPRFHHVVRPHQVHVNRGQSMVLNERVFLDQIFDFGGCFLL